MSKPTFTLEEQHAMAREQYPAEYAAAGRLTGKKRQNRFRALRDRVVYAAQMAALPLGARCATCQFYGKIPGDTRRCCDLDSDFHGYALRGANDSCPDWQEVA